MNNHSRISKTINSNWLFSYAPASELDENNPPEAWKAISLPHTWHTYETTKQIHPFIHDPAETDNDFWWKGWGWYKKELVLDSTFSGKKIFAEFDGVQKYCRVYLNGEFLVEHKGGFNSFYADLTNSIKFDEKNILTIAVSNLQRDPRHIPPMDAGNWDVYGGIYRDVRLVITDKLHIPYQGSHEHEGGTFVSTPEVSADQALVRIKTYIKNDYDEPKECALKHTILDPAGKAVMEMEESLHLQPNESREHAVLSEPLKNPMLWTPDSPSLYHVTTEITLDGRVVDHHHSPLGFRWYHWDYEKKTFHLNGKALNLVGTNRHQEYPWLGDAIPKWMHKLDMDDIKYNLNHNFIRTCHYTQDPYLYDYCDRHGILVCEEVPNIKYRDFDNETQKQNVIEMIRRDRNHPCIVMWSMGNETNCAADGDWAREEDSERIIHFRKCVGRGEEEPHNSSQIDMENLLRCTIRGWYDADDIVQDPPNDYTPENGQRASTEEFQHKMARVDNGSIRHRIDWPNVVTWIYADHGADREYGSCPLKHVNPKGWVDSYRFPKYIYHLWRANYSSEPMIYVHPHFWREKYIGMEKTIVVDSNCDSVELFVNDEPYGKKEFGKENFHTNEYSDIPIAKGRLDAIGTKAGKTIRHTIFMAGEAAKLTLEASHDEITADRSGIAILTARIVDKDGHHVIGACPDLHWEVEGPATLIGPDHYVNDHGKDGAMGGIMYFDTPISNLIRSETQEGSVKVVVSSPGLEQASIIIECVKPNDETIEGIQETNVVDSAIQPDYSLWEKEGKQRRHSQINIIYQDLDFGAAEKDDYYRMIDEFITKNNPMLDRETPRYKEMLQELCEVTLKNNGVLIADDFCFITGK